MKTCRVKNLLAENIRVHLTSADMFSYMLETNKRISQAMRRFTALCNQHLLLPPFATHFQPDLISYNIVV